MDDDPLDPMQRAMQRLPPWQRRLIELYHFEHRSYDEIAEQLCLQEAVVKSRLNRARLALKGHLGEGGAGALVPALLPPVPPSRSGRQVEPPPRDAGDA